MKINTKSWHYRFLNTFSDDIPTSLCPYFWKTVTILGIWSAFAVIFSFLFYMIGNKIFTSIGWVYGNPYIYSIAAACVGLLIIATAVVFVFAAVFGCFWVKENFKPPYKEEPMIISFIKAKKSKICPTLEFVDMSNNQEKTEE